MGFELFFSCQALSVTVQVGALRVAPTPCVTMTVAPRIQCPAIIAFLLNLLGAILSFTCIPVSTKRAGAQGQAGPPGKSHQGCRARILGGGRHEASPPAAQYLGPPPSGPSLHGQSAETTTCQSVHRGFSLGACSSLWAGGARRGIQGPLVPSSFS